MFGDMKPVQLDGCDFALRCINHMESNRHKTIRYAEPIRYLERETTCFSAQERGLFYRNNATREI